MKSAFPLAPSINVSIQEEWINVLINEEEAEVLSVLNSIQSFRKISDITMEEISTESVIKKIYEGGVQ